MPIYQYRCEECGNKIEVLQTMGGVAQLCCGKAMAKLVALPADFTGRSNRSAIRKWSRDWYPGKPNYSTGSLHGEKY